MFLISLFMWEHICEIEARDKFHRMSGLLTIVTKQNFDEVGSAAHSDYSSGVSFFPSASGGPSTAAAGSLLLLAPKVSPDEAWIQKKFGEAAEYRRITMDSRPTIHAIGRNSASGLSQGMGYRLSEYPWLEWAWRVDRRYQNS